MKEFFAWYMIASVIGVWTIVAYVVYRMSKMLELVSSLQKIVLDLEEKIVLDLEVSKIVMKSDIKDLWRKQRELSMANNVMNDDIKSIKALLQANDREDYISGE